MEVEEIFATVKFVEVQKETELAANGSDVYFRDAMLTVS